MEVESEVYWALQIMKRVGPVAHQLALPMDMSKIYNVFLVSILQKYIPDLTRMLET